MLKGAFWMRKTIIQTHESFFTIQKFRQMHQKSLMSQ